MRMTIKNTSVEQVLSLQLLVIAPHLDDNDTRDTCTLKIENQQIKPNGNLKIPGFNMDSELSASEIILVIYAKRLARKLG